MNTDNWINDKPYTCAKCRNSFKVSFKENKTTRFCPYCGNPNLIDYNKDKLLLKI